MRLRAFALLLLVASGSFAGSDDGDVRLSLDVKDAPVSEVIRVLTEVAGFQAAIDPGVSCRLTLKLRNVPFHQALDETLRACALGRQEDGTVLRVATLGKLAEEQEATRRLKDAKELSAPLRVASFRLSYARAQELAPIVKKVLAPRGDVVFDPRTNTLLVID